VGVDDLGVSEAERSSQRSEFSEFDAFETQIRFPHIRAHRDRAVPIQHQRVVSLDEFAHRERTLRARRRRVRRGRNRAEIVHHFGQNAFRERDACKRTRNRVRRMRVDDRTHVGALAVTFEMNPNFGRGFQVAPFAEHRRNFFAL